MSLFSVNAKFASLEFVTLSRADSVSGACEDISIILNLLIYTLAILSASSVDTVLQQGIITKW